ncbi:MAG: tetratricopeptide repeat protein [Rhizomicrobium sp.]
MKLKFLAVAGMSAAALVASAPVASAYGPPGCFVAPSVQQSIPSLIAILDRSIAWQRRAEDLACKYYGRGLLYQFQGDTAKAIADFDHAIGWMETYGDAYAARADAEDATGKHDAAQKDYALAAANAADLPARLTERCWVRALRGYPLPLAVQDCTQALGKEPDSVNALTARGFAEFRMGNYAAAIADTDAALKLQPKDGSAMFIRGAAKLKSGDATGGNADLAAANALTDRIADVYAIYGVKL